MLASERENTRVSLSGVMQVQYTWGHGAKIESARRPLAVRNNARYGRMYPTTIHAMPSTIALSYSAPGLLN